MFVEHRALLTYMTARFILFAVYLGGAMFTPSVSAIRVPFDLLDAGAEPSEPALTFIGAHLVALLVASIALTSGLKRARPTG